MRGKTDRVSLRAFSTVLSRRLTGAALAIVAATFAACAASAQEATPPPDQSPLHSLAKGLGFATDVDPPPGFVQQSRPVEPAAEIPIFDPPGEPPGKAKSAKEVEAIDSDLESIAKRHDALRAAYPPAAKAVAAAAAEKKVKSKPKPAVAGAPPL
jgi:hypothetical protein